MDWYFLGVDVGQSQDFSALTVLERKELEGEFDYGYRAIRKVIELRLRHLERIPLGTSYVTVAERVRDIAQSAELAGRCQIVVDATGVGRPVVELIESKVPGCPLKAVTVTSGIQETQVGDYWGVPKRDLISGLQIVLQTEELKIAEKMRFGKELREELAAMEVRQTKTGYEQYGARAGSHDDLVFAVSLACWAVRKAFPGRKLGYWTREGGEAELRRLARGI